MAAVLEARLGRGEYRFLTYDPTTFDCLQESSTRIYSPVTLTQDKPLATQTLKPNIVSV